MRQVIRTIKEAHAYNMAVLMVAGAENTPSPDERLSAPIDIWWVVHDGGLQLLLSTILRKNRVWSRCRLRVFCVLQANEDADALRDKVVDFLYKMRIDGEVKCVILHGTKSGDALNRHRNSKPFARSYAIIAAGR